jgi:tripartite-type tricarboxylate transporter receptor subunit TctC
MAITGVRHCRWLGHVLCVLLGIGATALSEAAEYPTKTVSIIVPFTAGGSADAQARPLAKGLSERLGKPVIVDNRPGAGGSIGRALAARAAPDGHTLLYSNFSMLVSEPILRAETEADLRREFAPITLLVEQPLILVASPSLGVGNLAELIKLAARSPGKLTYATWGQGSSGHLFAEMFKAATGLQIEHVPYKGQAPALTDILGGHVSMMFVAPLAVMPHLRAGRLQAFAVSGQKRMSTLPQVPTLRESGVAGLELRVWSCLLAPARTPPDVLARIHKATAGVLATPEFARVAENDGAVVLASSPEELMRRIEADSESVRKLLKNVKLDAER